MDPDDVVDVLLEEGGAGHAGHAHLPGHFLAELHVGLAGLQVLADVGQHEVSALGIRILDADVVQALGEQGLHVGVMGAEFLVVAIRHLQARNGGLHQHGGGAHGVEVVELLDPIHQMLGGNGIAQPPAGDGIGLGQGAAGYRPLPHAGQGAHIDVLMGGVNDVLVHLVHDHVGVIADGHIPDELELLLGKHLAAGVGGVADQNGLCSLLEGILQHVGVKVEGGGDQGHEDGLAVRHDGLGPVVFKVGGEHDDLIPRVGEGENGIHHGLGGADGDHHIGVRVQVQAHEMAAFFGQGLAEVGGAHGNGILMGADGADLGQPVGDGLGRIEIRIALGQVDGAAGQGNAGHTADDGIGKLLCFTADVLHKKRSFFLSLLN